MTTRQIALSAIVIVLAAIGVVAILKPVLSEPTIHWLHVGGLVLGGLDVIVVAVSFICAEPSH